MEETKQTLRQTDRQTSESLNVYVRVNRSPYVRAQTTLEPILMHGANNANHDGDDDDQLEVVVVLAGAAAAAGA